MKFVTLSILLLSASSVAFANDAPKASVTCVACHGADGDSTIPMYPKLKGQHKQYLATQLKKFRSGDRKDPVMSAMAKPLSDADIDALAEFYSKL